MKTRVTIKADFEIELPALPNFIKTSEGAVIDVADMHDESLGEIADSWKMALIRLAAERRKGENDPK